jgi:hypothetical protein
MIAIALVALQESVIFFCAFQGGKFAYHLRAQSIPPQSTDFYRSQVTGKDADKRYRTLILYCESGHSQRSSRFEPQMPSLQHSATDL